MLLSFEFCFCFSFLLFVSLCLFVCAISILFAFGLSCWLVFVAALLLRRCSLFASLVGIASLFV